MQALHFTCLPHPPHNIDHIVAIRVRLSDIFNFQLAVRVIGL